MGRVKRRLWLWRYTRSELAALALRPLPMGTMGSSLRVELRAEKAATTCGFGFFHIQAGCKTGQA